MKKTLLLFVLFIVLAFSGCGPAASEPSEPLPSDPASEPTPEPGSEENPMKTGETFLGVYTDGDEKSQYNIGISLQEVVRGSQAMDVLREAHALNPKPEEGKEYIIARFQVRYISDATEGNPPLYLNKFNFAFFPSEGEQEALPIVIMPEPAFDITLSEPGVADGWLVFSADIDDDSPKAVFAKSLYFDLSGDPS